MGSRLNPVVASLVFAAAETPLPSEASTGDVIARRWARQYAIKSLETAESIERPRDARPAVPRRPRRWSNPEDRSPRSPCVGLVGPNSRYGLGHIYRDLAKHLEVKRWLIQERPGERDFPPSDLPCPWTLASPEQSDVVVTDWLRGLDAILFIETPPFPGLCRAAREQGVLVICHPNWEWLHPGLDWLDDVDVMLCPTRRTSTMLAQWQRQFGFDWIVEDFPWPIDPHAFRFRRRYRAEQFVYVHGSGGFFALRNGRESEVIRRKGLAPLLQAAREVPQIPLIVYGPAPRAERVPGNVEFRSPPDENHELYLDGDVCIQPSLWEGLGLPLLECQAAGMPLITTGLPPMNEHSPYAVIPAREVAASLKHDFWIPAAEICPDDIARVMRNSYRRWIPFASGRARRFIVGEHNWRKVRGALLQKISRWVSGLQDGQ